VQSRSIEDRPDDNIGKRAHVSNDVDPTLSALFKESIAEAPGPRTRRTRYGSLVTSPLVAAASVFEGFRPATCLPDDCFCEAVRDSLVRQPANTWSSLAFVLVAVWIALRLRSPGRARRALPGAEAGLLIAALTLLGLGSAFYHATLTFVGQVVDVSGMYLVATFILLHRLGPRFSLPPIGSVLVFVTANAGLMAAQVTTPSLRRIVFGVLLVTALAVEWGESRRGRAWLSRGALLMLLAFMIWALDRERLICDPASLLQGHALWHGLGALAAACLFRSYEDEAAAEPASLNT
jgi:Ceramidase